LLPIVGRVRPMVAAGYVLLACASTASSAAAVFAVLLCAITGNVQAPMRLGVRSSMLSSRYAHL